MKRYKDKATKQRWYYDACVLDKEKNIFGDIINKDHIKESIVSHLALGEAYGKCLSKGEVQADAFIKLINTLKKYIRVVGNDAPKEILDKVKNKFITLRLADAVHLATAINYKCSVFKTSDYDLYRFSKRETNDLSQDCNGTNLVIHKM